MQATLSFSLHPCVHIHVRSLLFFYFPSCFIYLLFFRAPNLRSSYYFYYSYVHRRRLRVVISAPSHQQSTHIRFHPPSSALASLTSFCHALAPSPLDIGLRLNISLPLSISCIHADISLRALTFFVLRGSPPSSWSLLLGPPHPSRITSRRAAYPLPFLYPARISLPPPSPPHTSPFPHPTTLGPFDDLLGGATTRGEGGIQTPFLRWRARTRALGLELEPGLHDDLRRQTQSLKPYKTNTDLSLRAIPLYKL